MEFNASVQKVPGRFVLQGHELRWQPVNGAGITIDLTKVVGMRATPPTSANARILLTGEADASLMKINFTGRDALDAAKDALQKAIQEVRQNPQASKTEQAVSQNANGSSEPSTNGVNDINGSVKKAETTTDTNTDLQSQQLTQAPKRPGKKAISLDPSKLLANIELQRQVLTADEQLRRMFQQVVVSGNLSNDQFWEMRMDRLVTAAQAQLQKRGSYNVLSTIKPTTGSDNKINLSLTRDKIKDIFDQYPIVRRAYNDNVPTLSEGEFWQRFFVSRLFLTLRGEKVSINHPFDNVIDKYIAVLEEQRRNRQQQNQGTHVPLFLDVEGNDVDVPGVVGNGPDMTMKLGVTNDKSAVSLIRSMNGLSKRLLRGRQTAKSATPLPPSAEQRDKELEEQVVLHDLEIPQREGHDISVRVRGEDPYGGEQPHHPTEALEKVRQKMADMLADPLDLSLVGDVDAEDVAASRKQIETLLEQQAEQGQALHLEATVNMEKLIIVHVTTLEFLRHFWNAQRKGELLDPYVDSLRNSLLRMDAVIAESESQPERTRAALSSVVKSVGRALELSSSMIESQ